MEKIYDFLIIGGGLVGSSLAYGLSKEKFLKIAIVDAYDDTYRASIGNYGLTWLQSKGYNDPSYARMAERSIVTWDDFRQELEEGSGVDLEFVQRGGLHFCFNEEEFENRARKMNDIGMYYEHEQSKSIMLDQKNTKELYPGLGDEVVGSSYNRLDGYLSPAKLLQAQLKLCIRQKVDYIPNFSVVKIKKSESEYEIMAYNGDIMRTKQLILTAGLSNKNLAEQVGVNIPIKPEKGHILVTQKVHNLDLLPSLNIRQAKDGGLLLGYSNEDVGYDVSINENIVEKIIKKAMRILPEIKNINILRSWASLRIMPKDGKSIYDTIDKTLHIVSTHSGVTFAPIHARELSNSILHGVQTGDFKNFSLDRFKKEH